MLDVDNVYGAYISRKIIFRKSCSAVESEFRASLIVYSEMGNFNRYSREYSGTQTVMTEIYKTCAVVGRTPDLQQCVRPIFVQNIRQRDVIVIEIYLFKFHRDILDSYIVHMDFPPFPPASFAF